MLISVSLMVAGQNQNISNGNVFDGEPYLAVNPQNPQHLVVGWMGHVLFNQIVIKTKVSEDGGETWSEVNWLPHSNSIHSSADPIIEFDNDGNVYAVYIDFSAAAMSGSVFSRKSTDGGYTWGEEVLVIDISDDDNSAPIDRPWVAIDRSGGENDGNIYITSMPGTGQVPVTPPFHPYFVRSTDGGESFEPWKHLDGEGWLTGSLVGKPMPAPTVGPDGTFHAIYPSFVFSQNVLPQYIIASSDDAGDSFSYNTVYASNETVSDSLAKKGYLLRANPANSDHLVFLHLSDALGDIDIFLRESFDAGETWTDAQRINDDPVGNDRMQDLVWADFDEDGDLIVTWRDRRNALSSSYQTQSEIWGAFRHRDSTSFAPNFPLSDTQAEYDDILDGSGNDFMCVQLAYDTIYAVWGDTRDGKLNIWFQRMSTDGTIVSTVQISSEESPKYQLYPNPTEAWLWIEGPAEKVIISDMAGSQIRTDSFTAGNSQRIDMVGLPSGLYNVSIFYNGKLVTTEKVIVRP